MVTLLNPTSASRHERPPQEYAIRQSASAALNSSIQAHLGQHLRTWYGDPAGDRLPPKLAQHLDRVAQVIRARTELINQAFVDEVLASVTSLRAFAISLTRDAEKAEDLVQETVLRAISKQEQFVAGTNLQAWLFTILRNQFCSEHRKSLREVEDGDGSYAATMIALPDQDDRIMIHDLEAALQKLPEGQREAIMLVGVEGLSYEEAAQVLGCAVGTVKSRVNRARSCLAELMRLAGEDGFARSHIAEL
ncbi:sigma-70 family RNA polymerase sigma factor [Microvirga tunisiensis]|uniref:RNA polymerase sigma factor n=1 Tax=Microvirga tunisiensis TaxID=2108360 RepID=A0A5N7MNK1_9HYPH|nr:sigma-70 family RNA polymerase sigma factor [Microvirga tunisiensis]MPR10225.1 sigma-70 family RNA polymerase sigma factor [Microvirga tunisiensis]MPR28428.1 sigma-70 family RNA polymerase sigma factor [Microvirga tunisiensis]